MTGAASLLSRLNIAADHDGGIVVGFSGGLDSSVLLEALVRAGLGPRVTAVHVHHGLHADADIWAEHCRRFCEQRALAFHCERVTLEPGGNVESRARAARYAALRRHLDPGGRLWLAHHRDDQAETVLLRLLRGTGARGLAGMAPVSTRQGMTIVRPLLDVPRAQLGELAHAWGLDWLDDPSNSDLRFNRNFLRLQVLPLLRGRLPDVPAHLARTAARLAEDARLLDELAALDLASCDAREQSLALAPFRGLPPHRQRNLLRGWLGERGFLPPDARILERVLDEVLPARDDAAPRVSWADGVFTRYADRLWLMRHQQLEPWVGEARWVPGETGVLELGALRIEACADDEPADLLLPADRGEYVLRSWAGGERLALNGHHRKVKELWRVAGVPPWRRRQLPLFFHDDELVAAPFAGVADGWQPEEGEPVLRLRLSERFPESAERLPG